MFLKYLLNQSQFIIVRFLFFLTHYSINILKEYYKNLFKGDV